MNIENIIEHAMNLKNELEKTDKETWTKQEVNDFSCRTCQFYDCMICMLQNKKKV